MNRLRPLVVAAAILGLVVIFYHGLVLQRLVIGDYDAFVYFYPLRQYAARVLGQGGFPLWNPFTFMGAPFFANIQTAVLYPPNLLFLFLPTPYAFSASVVCHVLLAASGMYLFCRKVLGVEPVPAVMGALAFSLGGFISFQVSHINQLSVSAWLPLLLVVFDAAVRRRSGWIAVGAGLIATLQLLAGHTQEWYFSTVTLGLFALWRILVRDDLTLGLKIAGGAQVVLSRGTLQRRLVEWAPRLVPFWLLLAVGIVEGGLASVQILPTMELSGQSIRGGGLAYGEAVSFSLPPTSALYTLLPTYPSSLFSEYVGYVGIVPLVLAAIGVAGWGRRRITLFMVALVVVGLVMALGGYNPLAPMIFRIVPGLSLFRVPARWLLVYSFGVAGLAALGTQLLVEGRRIAGGPVNRLTHPSARSQFLVVVALLGAAAVALGLFGLLARPAPQRGMIAVWGAMASLAIIIWSAGWVRRRFRTVAALLLVVASATELWYAGDSAVYRHPVPVDAYALKRESTSYLLDRLKEDGVPERVLSVATDNYEVKETPDYKKAYSWLDTKALTDFMVDVKLSETLAPNVPMEYGIQTPDGYDGGVLPLKRYGVLKSLMLPPEGDAPDSLLRNNLRYIPPLRFLDLLGVKYVLAGKARDAKVENVYYDRGISLDLRNGDSVTLKQIQDIQSTSVGVISSTVGARGAPNGTSAGTLVVKDDSGKTFELPLRLGTETGETAIEDGKLGKPAHDRPETVSTGPGGNGDTDYFVKIRLPARVRVKEVTITGGLADGTLRVRAITIIDDVAALIAPLSLSDNLPRQEFFDMKVYSYSDPLPRAYVAYGAAVRDDEVALGELESGAVSIRDTVLLAPSRTARGLYRLPGPGFRADDAKVLSYGPEEIVVQATAREDGYLVLGDAYYPGWSATVDGKDVPIERANYLFRGVYLGKGQHQVVFSYRPNSFQNGVAVSGASVLLLGCAGMASIAGRRRGRVL